MRRFPLWPVVIAMGTLLVLGLFLAIVVRNVDEMRILRDQSFSIEHTLEVQRALDAVLISQSEVDVAVRGYLLSGSAQVLDTVRTEQQTTLSQLHEVAAIIAGNPSQQRRMEQLRTAIDRRHQLLEEVIAVRRTGTIDDAMARVRAANSTSARDAIRVLIADMERDEATELAARRSTASGAYIRAVNGRIGSGIMSAALLIAVVFVAGLNARSKARREEALLMSEQRSREAIAREQDSRAEAERANRAKDQFLAILSHELRTPLNAVLGWTQILQSTDPSEPTIVRALASIRRNAEAQQHLVEDLLDVSRIVSGKLPIEREPFDLRSAIATAIESIRPAAELKGIDLTADLDVTAPTVGDAGRLQQVAGNLLANAVKFTPAGGQIAVALRDGGGAAKLSIADTGSGISPELLPHIFDRFRQGDGSTTRAHGGLGLGLAIAKHIVEAHRGSIEVESRGLNTGATFRVTLPYR